MLFVPSEPLQKPITIVNFSFLLFLFLLPNNSQADSQLSSTAQAPLSLESSPDHVLTKLG